MYIDISTHTYGSFSLPFSLTRLTYLALKRQENRTQVADANTQETQVRLCDAPCAVLHDLNIKIKFEGGEDLDDLIHKYVSKDLVRVCF